MDAPVIAPAATVCTAYNKKILVVMPWQKQVNPLTALCVGRLTDSRRTAMTMQYNDAFVVHSRNACADTFLKSPLEWMLTIDDDMVCPFGDSQWFKANTDFNFPEKFLAWNTLDRLMSAGKSLVGALYFGRSPGGVPVYGEGMNPAEAAYARKGPHDVVKPTRWVGTGCMLVHRTVFEDIEKRFPLLARKDGKYGHWFTSTEASLRDRVARLVSDARSKEEIQAELTAALAEANFENPLGTGEDVSFCLRAKAAGHQPYVDMGLICGHIGHCVYGPSNTGKMLP